jgi:hypothetical protein
VNHPPNNIAPDSVPLNLRENRAACRVMAIRLCLERVFPRLRDRATRARSPAAQSGRLHKLPA